MIMLTGFGDTMNAKGETPGGVDKVIGKPPTTASLRDALSSVLPGQPTATAAMPELRATPQFTHA